MPAHTTAAMEIRIKVLLLVNSATIPSTIDSAMTAANPAVTFLPRLIFVLLSKLRNCAALGLRDDRLEARDLACIHDAVDIEKDLYIPFLLRHAQNERRAQLGPEIGRVFDIGRHEVEHFRNSVNHQAN